MIEAEPGPIVKPEWLDSNLGDPQLRIFDCTVSFFGDDDSFRLESGSNLWQSGHIPGSTHVDLLAELSDNESPIDFMLPPISQIYSILEARGVNDDSWIVLYDSGDVEWAGRVWWILRDLGFDRASILDGGWIGWQLGNYPISNKAQVISPGKLSVGTRRHVYVTKEAVLKAIGDPQTAIVSALSHAEHVGSIARYGRPGRIPGSMNVPYRELFDRETRQFLPLEEIQAKIEAMGLEKSQKVITYCGGGVASSLLAFWFLQMGYSQVAVYDGSMLEWAADPTLPLEMG